MSYIYPSCKNSITRYKVYFVYNSKKIYLGLFDTPLAANNALLEAQAIMDNPVDIAQYTCTYIDYKKFISLCNFRNHHVYIKNPICIYDSYFCYYLSKEIVFTFDIKDLLFFSTYKICKRGHYVYTQDSVTQQSILSRFGIHPHSVCGVDYKFRNGNLYDFRRENLEIVNAYKGVTHKIKNDESIYITKIFINQNVVIGHYLSQLEAAIAYNKAIDILFENGNGRDYIKNTIPYLTRSEYNQIYDKLDISPRIKVPAKQKRVVSTKQYRGTCKDKSGFRASIGYKGVQMYLGIYPTEKRAAQAYNFASFYLYGNNGYINDINPLIYHNDSDQIARQLSKYNILKTPVVP